MTLSEKAKKMELEILLNQYDYNKKELKAKEDYSNVINGMFNESVLNFLDENEAIKKDWENSKKIKDEKIEELVKDKKTSIKSTENKSKLHEHSNLEKEVFRNIAKETHPDKFKDSDSARTNIYIQASEAYESRDLASLLLASMRCGVHFDISDDILLLMDTIKESIEKSKSRNNFLTSTIPWKWYHAPDIVKNEIVKLYIESSFG